MSNLKVLYQDNHLIAVFKPAGILSQPTHKATAWQSQKDELENACIMDDIKKYLKETYKKPGNVFLGLLHRLDRPVCGVMLFAKTSKGASRLSEQFRNHTIEKMYQAIVIGKPEKHSGILVNKLGKDEKLKKAKEYDDGKEARLFYEVLKSNGRYSLLKIKIEGGKFHQIRSQLSLAGLPILGDVKYGAKDPLNDKSIALCATELSFVPATSNQTVKITTQIPTEWNNYLSTEEGLIDGDGKGIIK